MPDGLLVENVSKSYDNLVALAGVSFAVAPKQILFLIGPNGAGKSTLLRILSGLVGADSGKLFFNNKPLSTSNVRFMPDKVGLHKGMSGATVLSVFQQLYNIDPEPELPKKLILEPWLRKRIASYSKGTLQKLGLSLALMGSSKLVLLDEPFDGLDPLATLAAQECIRAKADSGANIVISSHRIDEALAIADTYAFLQEGRVVKSGQAKEYENYRVSFNTKDPETAKEVIVAHGGNNIRVDSALEDLRETYNSLYSQRVR